MSPGDTILGSLTDQLEAAIMIVVTQNDEEGSQLALKTLTDNLENPDQVLVAEVGREHGTGLDEVVSARPIFRRPRRLRDENGSWIIAANVVVGPRVRLLPVCPELVKNGNPNLGLESDSVPDGHTFESWRTQNRLVAAKKS